MWKSSTERGNVEIENRKAQTCQRFAGDPEIHG
jgi:hypothetical protein